jgi:hypothetical protein
MTNIYLDNDKIYENLNLSELRLKIYIFFFEIKNNYNCIILWSQTFWECTLDTGILLSTFILFKMKLYV